MIVKVSVTGGESDTLIVPVNEVEILKVIERLTVAVGGGVTENDFVDVGDSVQLIDAVEVGVGGGVSVEVNVQVLDWVPVTDRVVVSVGGGVSVTDFDGVRGGVLVREIVEVSVVEKLADSEISSVSVIEGERNDVDTDRVRLRVLVRGSVMEAVAEVVVEGDWPEKENVGVNVPRVRLIVIEPAVIDIVAEIVKVPVG